MTPFYTSTRITALPQHLLPELEQADEIWRLGDVCSDDLLIEIESCGRPVFVVRGNCDNNFNWPLTRTLQPRMGSMLDF